MQLHLMAIRCPHHPDTACRWTPASPATSLIRRCCRSACATMPALPCQRPADLAQLAQTQLAPRCPGKTGNRCRPAGAAAPHTPAPAPARRHPAGAKPSPALLWADQATLLPAGAGSPRPSALAQTPYSPKHIMHRCRPAGCGSPRTPASASACPCPAGVGPSRAGAATSWALRTPGRSTRARGHRPDENVAKQLRRP